MMCLITDTSAGSSGSAIIDGDGEDAGWLVVVGTRDAANHVAEVRRVRAFVTVLTRPTLCGGAAYRVTPADETRARDA